MQYKYKNLCIKEHHNLTGTKNTAVYSLCERYRYFLERVWDANRPPLVMLMLNLYYVKCILILMTWKSQKEQIN